MTAGIAEEVGDTLMNMLASLGGERIDIHATDGVFNRLDLCLSRGGFLALWKGRGFGDFGDFWDRERFWGTFYIFFWFGLKHAEATIATEIIGVAFVLKAILGALGIDLKAADGVGGRHKI